MDSRHFLIAILFGLGSWAQAAECNQINLLYSERPPYLVNTSRGVVGVTATMTNKVFSTAGISYRWIDMPVLRQVKTIEANQGCDCIPGVVSNEARLAYSRFTDVLYHDQMLHVLVRDSDNRIKPGDNVLDVLKRRDLVLQVKAGHSYGNFIDQQIAVQKPKLEVTTLGERLQTVLKIAGGRADYLFITPTEADVLINQTNLPRGVLRVIPLSGIPDESFRRIMCSLRVNEEIIQQLNTAIAKVRKEYSEP